MGVPYYFYQIYKKYNDESELMITERDITHMKIDHLFFDYNSMIHPCAQQVISTISNLDISENELEKRIIENCIIYTNYILNLLNPLNVHITIDGVAPKAKINQQRERRYKSCHFKILTNEEDNENTNEECKKIEWDSNKITPGTFFMKKLKDELTNYIELNKSKFNISISDSDECGEGEHKMMDYISKKLNDKDNICIYGLDADLIMLSMINKKSDKIILLRDNSFNNKLNDSQRVFTYLDIKKLKISVCNEIRNLFKRELKDNELYKLQNIFNDNQIINDYVVLCFLLGNDFLEHIPSLNIKDNGINMLLKSYINAVKINTKPLIDVSKINGSDDNWKDSINLNVLKDIFEKISGSEEYYFSNVFSPYKMDKSKTTKNVDSNESIKIIYRDTINLDILTSDDTLEKGLYFSFNDCIKYNKHGYKKRYYSYYGVENVEKACQNYIEGIYWIFGYYKNHVHNNWTWDYKYNAVPFASDIYNFLKNNSENNIKKNVIIEKTEPNSQVEQLILVLPKKSLLNIINEVDIQLYERLIRLFRSNSNDIKDIFPESLFIDMIHKDYLWKSKILFKKFDIEYLKILM